MLFAGDIGGTKTDLVNLSGEAGPRSPLSRAEMRRADYSSLQVLAAKFLKKVKTPVELACLDVAGPVESLKDGAE